MNLLKILFLAVLQGVTEFLPVSSSGHLVLAGHFVDVDKPGVLLKVILHAGTLISIIVYFHMSLWSLVRRALAFEADAWKFAGLIILSSLPANAAYIAIGDLVEEQFAQPLVASTMLCVTGLLLIAVHFVPDRQAIVGWWRAAGVAEDIQRRLCLPSELRVSRRGVCDVRNVRRAGHRHSDAAARQKALLDVRHLLPAGRSDQRRVHPALKPLRTSIVRFFRSNRVLYVANSLVVNGGVERRNLDQILHLREQGLDVHVCVLRALGEVADIYRGHGIPVFHYHAYDTGENCPLRIHLPAFLRFWWFVLRGRYRIIIGSQFPSHYLARLACLPPLGRRVFAMERGIIANRKAKYRRLDRLCALWTRRVICISGAVADQMDQASRVPQKRLIVIEEGYAPLSPVPHPPSDLQETLRRNAVIGCVGNFTPLKRQETLVRAFARVYREHPDTRLVLVGDGDRREDVEQIVEHLDIRSGVIFTGAVDNAHAYYPFFDIFAFPSISEGLGGVFVEARLHRLPVICADVRPMSDYIRHGIDGLVFAPDDADDLARQITELLENSELSLKISEEGCEQAKRVFDREQQMARLYNLLTESTQN